MTNRSRSAKRAIAPKPVRQIARAAHLSLRKVAWTVFAGQPSPSTPREHLALIRWLSMSAANADPGIDEDELMEQVVAGLKTMAETGDQTAKAVMEARLHETAVALARTAIALNGAP